MIDLLTGALDTVMTRDEDNFGYLSTVEHALRKQAKKGETCAAFLKRTQKALTAPTYASIKWRRA